MYVFGYYAKPASCFNKLLCKNISALHLFNADIILCEQIIRNAHTVNCDLRLTMCIREYLCYQPGAVLAQCVLCTIEIEGKHCSGNQLIVLLIDSKIVPTQLL